MPIILSALSILAHYPRIMAHWSRPNALGQLGAVLG